MSDPEKQPYNPYAAPIAKLESQLESAQFYLVSSKKFWLLFMLTFGGYSIVWMYLHWDTIRKHTGEVLWPAPRSVFQVFFFHALFQRFQQAASMRAGRPASSLAGIATVLVVVSITSSVLNRLSQSDRVPEFIALLPIFLLPIQAWLFHFAQRVANYAAGDDEGKRNSTFSGINVLWMFLGGIWWVLVLLGSFMILFGDRATDMMGLG
jgi:hypothetical protein